MYPAVLFPDVLELEATYLRAALAARAESFTQGVHVSNRLPNPAPSRSVILLNAGGSRVGPVLAVRRLIVNVRATTPKQVTDLTRMVHALLLNQPSSVVKHVEDVGGPVDVEDVMPRQFFTVELTVKGSDLT